MENLTAKIAKLNEKTSWIKKEFKSFMDLWEKETKTSENIRIRAKVFADDYDNYFLITGLCDLCVIGQDNKIYTWCNKKFWHEQNIEIIKETIKNLPNAIATIEKKIDDLRLEGITLPTF